jgi:dihydrodipicolinate synthase/N-acetylneuraminate lyase
VLLQASACARWTVLSGDMKRYPSCILATCCSAWDDRGRFAEPAFRRLVQTSLRGTKHLYVFGTAGEGYAVSEAQFDTVARVFSEEMRAAGADPMFGVISLSLSTILDRIGRCADRGIRTFQIALPSWGALSDLELRSFFRAVCDGFPECRFVHYNLPRTKRMLTAAEYGELAERHPNLVGTKNCTDSLSFVYGLLHEAPQLQHFLTETGYLYGSLFGECGILASLVTGWSQLHEIFAAGKQRDVARYPTFVQECELFTKLLFDCVGDARIDGAYDKIFARVLVPDFPLRLLPPYDGTPDREFHEFVSLLRERLPAWLPAGYQPTHTQPTGAD